LNTTIGDFKLWVSTNPNNLKMSKFFEEKVFVTPVLNTDTVVLMYKKGVRIGTGSEAYSFTTETKAIIEWTHTHVRGPEDHLFLLQYLSRFEDTKRIFQK